MRIRLGSYIKKTVEGETEHNKNTKMASAMAFCSVQWQRSMIFCPSNPNRLNIFYSTNTSMQSATVVVVVVVMKRRRVRDRRFDVKGWGDGVIDTLSMRICCPNKNARAAFFCFCLLFFILRTVFKKCVYRHCIYRIHLDDRLKRCKTCVYTKKCFHVGGPLITHCKAFLS